MRKISKVLISSLLIGTTSIVPTVAIINQTTISQTAHISNLSNNIPKKITKDKYHSLPENYQSVYFPQVSKEDIQTDVNIDENDKTLNRFKYLYYTDNTLVNVYNYTKKDTDKFKSQSINTYWESADGFAKIVDTKIEPTIKPNTFMQVFAGNVDIASYFAMGIDNVYKPCTRQSILSFLSSQKSLINLKTLDFSYLYLNDLDRDNSVLAILNPELWDIIIDYSLENPQRAITSIDLSNNSLRIIPNFASIINENGTNWYFDDINTSMFDPSGISGMNHCSINDGLSSLLTHQNGYFEEINLERNEITYLNLNPYTDFDHYIAGDTDYDWKPGLPSIMRNTYDGFMKYKKIYAGLKLNYNHLPYIFIVPSSEPINGVWWYRCYTRWYNISQEPIVLLNALGWYVDYTTGNYNSQVITAIEKIVGLGCYQTDKLTLTNRDVRNYLNSIEATKTILTNHLPSELTEEESLVITNAINDFINISQTYSIPLGTTLLNFSYFTAEPYISTELITDDFNGQVGITILSTFSRDVYLPADIDYNTVTSVSDLVSRILTYVTLQSIATSWVAGFKTNATIVIVFWFSFTILVVYFFTIFLVKFIIYWNKHHKYRMKGTKNNKKSK